MWIFDSYFKGCVELWGKEHGLSRASTAYPASFYMHLKGSHAHNHVEMIEALESLYGAEECSFKTIYGPLDGYRISAGRSVAEKIEKQTCYAAELYNVDLRQDQRYLAERDLSLCCFEDESRFSPDFDDPLCCMEVNVIGDPHLGEISCIEVLSSRRRTLRGSERTIIADLLELIKAHDPDVILTPHGDLWTRLIVHKARRYGLDQTISRSGWFRHMASRSYWSYGRASYRDGALIPEGRVLIDTIASFAYREGGLKGVLLASRLSGLPPNLTSRFTPGTLISSYEVYEALRRGLAIPFRKRDAECTRGIRELKGSDKGGMIFQPRPGVYDDVCQLDFTSLYPSIIVKYNLSPETLDRPELKGFLSGVIAPLLSMRIDVKRRKKADPESVYFGMDAVLKWMLVTCFGYTGYRNAKFGQIQVHERITALSREILLQIKEIAEDMGLEVLHGIVDCLWVRGGRVSSFKEAVERETGIPSEVEDYDWIAFLPMADGSGAYNRYFGRLSNGKAKMKIRGVMARKGDTPAYVKRMQHEIFEVLGRAESLMELCRLEPEARDIFRRYSDGLNSADAREMAISRRISRVSYSRRCAEGSAIAAYKRQGISLVPGMEISYVVKDAGRWLVDSEMDASEFDVEYYRKLLDKAWSEAAFVFGRL